MKSIMMTVTACSMLLMAATFGLAVVDGQAIVDQSCTSCHSVKRICKNVGDKYEMWWQETISRMAGNGAQISASEQLDLAVFLAEPPESFATSCE